MKKLVIALLGLMVSFPMVISAQNTVTIHQKDGTAVYFGFEEKPVITYTDNDLVIKTINTEVQYALASISKITFTDPETAVISVEDDMHPAMELDNNFISITGAKPDANVIVVGADGKTVINVKTNSEGVVSFSIATLPEGVYVISSDNINCKLLKK